MENHSALHLFNNTLPKLAKNIHDHLTGITPMFSDFQLEQVVNTWAPPPDSWSDEPISIENGNVRQMIIRLRLEGFHHPGTPTFDLAKDLLFKLKEEVYEVGPDLNEIWVRKQYLQPWTAEELENVAQSWCGLVIDEITQQLESFN